MAADVKIELDVSDFLRTIDTKLPAFLRASEKAEDEIADEALRLSQHEVPKDEGVLEGTGVADRDAQGAYVGYNKPYAARLHEHPEYSFQKGRKGKYLEDPIKHNLKVFGDHYVETVRGALK
jgi:hypothetical protein